MNANRGVVIVDPYEDARTQLVAALLQSQIPAQGLSSCRGARSSVGRKTVHLLLIRWPRTRDEQEACLDLCHGQGQPPAVVYGLGDDWSAATRLSGAGALDSYTLSLVPRELPVLVRKSLSRFFLQSSEEKRFDVDDILSAFQMLDVETEAHCQRVAETCVRLASILIGDQDSVLENARWGGYLHDVGKMAIPYALLHKTGPLTASDRALMRQHPDWGYRMLRRTKIRDEALAMVRHHHERWDGLGYPQGLAGEEIPLLARIASLADAVDAMHSQRPYRAGLPWETVERELCLQRGAQFDPRVVDAVLAQSDSVLACYDDRASLRGACR